MRRAAVFALSLSLCGPGCQRRAAPVSAESPAQAAARAFGRAQILEQEGQTKQAFAAYHQVARHFPETPEGKKAAERIRQAQRKALGAAARGKR